MRRNWTKVAVSALLAVFVYLTASGNVYATNGYFSHGYGVKSKGMAGAGAAFPQSSLAPATNPAGMTFLGNRYDVGLALFSPDREYTVTGNPSGMEGTFGLVPQSVRSDKRLFAIPSLGANRMVDSATSIGIAIYGNGGMNTTWPAAAFHGTVPTGVDLSQLFVTATVARQIVPGHSLGITGILGFQWFEAEGLQAFSNFSAAPANLTNNAHDNSNGFGVRIGYMGSLTPCVRVGGSFQSEISMSEFDSYAGLFAEQGDFDIPAT